MIPRDGTKPTLIEFALETARYSVRHAQCNYPFGHKASEEIRTKVDAAVHAIAESIGKKTIPFETWVDNSIVDRLTREGFIEQLYRTR